MNILVINAGSSSLKYQIINILSQQVLAKGLAERIGIEGGRIKHQYAKDDGFGEYILEEIYQNMLQLSKRLPVY